MLFVLDNSVSMRWLFKDGTEADLLYAEQVLEALKEGSAVVPGVWWLEVSNVIVRAEAQQLLPETQSRKFLDTLRKIPITVDSSPVEQLWEQTLHLARNFMFRLMMQPTWNWQFGRILFWLHLMRT